MVQKQHQGASLTQLRRRSIQGQIAPSRSCLADLMEMVVCFESRTATFLVIAGPDGYACCCSTTSLARGSLVMRAVLHQVHLEHFRGIIVSLLRPLTERSQTEKQWAKLWCLAAYRLLVAPRLMPHAAWMAVSNTNN